MRGALMTFCEVINPCVSWPHRSPDTPYFYRESPSCEAELCRTQGKRTPRLVHCRALFPNSLVYPQFLYHHRVVRFRLPWAWSTSCLVFICLELGLQLRDALYYFIEDLYKVSGLISKHIQFLASGEGG